MHAFNSEGNYVLFETGSPEPTRTWSREVYNCEKQCTNCPITRAIPTPIPFAEKLKYVVLKNPPSTARPKQAGWVSKENTILLNNVLYKVDPLVFPYLAAFSIQTCADLTKAIAEIRRVRNFQVPIGVKLAPVPLVQKVVKRVYLAGNDTKPQTAAQRRAMNRRDGQTREAFKLLKHFGQRRRDSRLAEFSHLGPGAEHAPRADNDHRFGAGCAGGLHAIEKPSANFGAQRIHRGVGQAQHMHLPHRHMLHEVILGQSASPSSKRGLKHPFGGSLRHSAPEGKHPVAGKRRSCCAGD
jgi:hypothetical protein